MAGETYKYFTRWGIVIPCTILADPYDAKHPDYVKVRMEDGGVTGVDRSELYDTRQALLDNMNAVSAEQVRKYENMITDVPSLVRFCLTHNISGCADCGDPEARAAAKNRAAALLNITDIQ